MGLLRIASQALVIGPRAVADLMWVPGSRCLGDHVSSPARRVGLGRLLAYIGLSVALWFAALVLLGVFVLAFLRGLLYGLVVAGPYTDAWGGPTFAGAWIVHALVALPLFAVAVLGSLGLAGLHTRLTQRLLDGSGPGWTPPVALLVGATAVVFFVAWTRQI